MKTNIEQKQLLFIVFLTQCFSLIFEQIFVKNLNLLVSDFLLSQSLSLSIYMLTVGIGALLGEKIKDEKLIMRMLFFQILLAIMYSTALPITWFIHSFVKITSLNILAPPVLAVEPVRLTIMKFSLPIIGLVGLLTGLELSAFLKIANNLKGEKSVNLVVFCSYLGGFTGTLFFAIFLPYLNMQLLLNVISFLVLFMSAYLYFKIFSYTRLDLKKASLILGTTVLIIVLFSYESDLTKFHLQSRYLQGVNIRINSLADLSTLSSFYKNNLPEQNDVIRIQTQYQFADFVTRPNIGTTLYLNGEPQLDPRWNVSYHEALAHIPIQLAGQVPKKILVLGAGDGLLINELLKYSTQIQSIDLVEIDPAIINLAQQNRFFLNLNKQSLDNKIVRIHILDALQFLRNSQDSYDAIYADFPLPFDYDLLKLYSFELFTLIHKHLNSNGYFSFDSAMDYAYLGLEKSINKNKWTLVLRDTLYAAGLKEQYPFFANESFMFVSKSPIQINTALKKLGADYQYLTSDILANSIISFKNKVPDFYSTFPKSENELSPANINSIFSPKLNYLKSGEL